MLKLFLYLIFFFATAFSELTKESCEDWIANTLSLPVDSSVKIYILDNIQYIPSSKFLPELKKISILKSSNENIYLKSNYVLYKVYKSTSSLDKIVSFLLDKPQKKDDKETPLLKAKIYLKNQLRAEAAKMIGELGDETHIKVLSKTVNDEDGVVSDASYFALAMLSKRGKIKLKVDDIKEFFYSGLKNSDYKVRLKAVKYLGELGYKDAAGPLSLRLKDTSKEVVLQTIISLGKIKDETVLQDLLQFSNSPEPSYKVALAEALGNLISNSTNTVVINKIKTTLNNLLNDSNGTVRVAAAVSLLKISDVSAIEVLKKGLNSTDLDVVLYCIEGLGNFGTVDDIKFIENFTQHQDLLVRAYAYVNILKIYYRRGN